MLLSLLLLLLLSLLSAAAKGAMLLMLRVLVVADAEDVVIAADDDSDEDVDVDCKAHVDHVGCKVQVVDQDVDGDALSDDDVEHVVDAVLCCFLSLSC